MTHRTRNRPATWNFPRPTVRRLMLVVLAVALGSWTVQTALRWEEYAAKAAFHGHRFRVFDQARMSYRNTLARAEEFLRTNRVDSIEGYDRFKTFRQQLDNIVMVDPTLSMGEQTIFERIHRRGISIHPDGKGGGWAEMCRFEIALARENLRRIEAKAETEGVLKTKYERAAGRPWQLTGPDAPDVEVAANR